MNWGDFKRKTTSQGGNSEPRQPHTSTGSPNIFAIGGLDPRVGTTLSSLSIPYPLHTLHQASSSAIQSVSQSLPSHTVADSNNGHSMSSENVDDLIVGNDASEYTSVDDGDGNSITKPSAFDNNAEETAEAEFDIDECTMDDLQMNGKKSRTSGIFMETQDEDVSVVESLTRSVEADGEESATEEEEEAPANTGPCEPDRSKLKRKVVQSLIDHSYYNYSLSNVEEELSRRSSQGQYKNPNRKGLTTNFPAKLHKILSNPEFRHIIRWMVRAMCVFMSAYTPINSCIHVFTLLLTLFLSPCCPICLDRWLLDIKTHRVASWPLVDCG
eukprot:scaffold4734_cov196-Alexandrium_tamarense.AAC.1